VARWEKQQGVFDKLLTLLPYLTFSTDGTCSKWPDKWNGVVYQVACLIHDFLYNEGRIHPDFYKLGRKRSDKILAYGIARRFRQQGKSTAMAGVMYRGLRMFGGVAWYANGKILKKKYPEEYAKYHGE